MEKFTSQRRKRRTYVIAAVIVTVLAVVIILVAVFANKRSVTPENEQQFGEDATCDDVAVIGAGIAGTYAAWRVRDRNLSVAVYEYSDRVGGRLFTVRFPDIPDIDVELGGMRFYPESHKLLNATVHAIGLPVKDFSPGVGWSSDDIGVFRGVRMRVSDLGGEVTPYNVRPEELVSYSELRWSLFINKTSAESNRSYSREERHHLTTLDGMELYKQSRRNAMAKMCSTEAYAYASEVNGFPTYQDEVSASYLAGVSDPSLPARVVTPSSVAGGMGSIPSKLLEKFLLVSKQHSYHNNRQLTTIRRRADGNYILNFQPTQTLSGITQAHTEKATEQRCAKTVVLGVSRLALERIDFEPFQTGVIHEYITRAVKDHPVAKIFFAYENKWWDAFDPDFRHSVTDLPIGSTYNFGTSKFSNRSVLNVGYLSDSKVPLWKEARGLGSSFPGTSLKDIAVSHEVVKHVHKNLAMVFNISAEDIPAPIGGIMKIWDSYPEGTGWNTWMPGYIWGEVGQKMIQPSPSDSVYVASNSFSGEGFTSWSEGALLAVEKVLGKAGLKD